MMSYILTTYILTDISSELTMYLYPLIYNLMLWIHLLFAPEDVLQVSVSEIGPRIGRSETSRPLK